MSAAPPIADERFHRLHPLSPLLRSGLFLVAWAGWVINSSRDGIHRREVALSGLIALGAGLVLGAGSWWFTRYRVSAEEIRVETGFLFRQSRRIRIERLQAVEVQQPLLARIFGMAELSLEVAGGDAGAKLAFLPLPRAVELRRQLLDRTPGGPADVAVDEPALYRVDPGRLLASQFLRTGFVSALVGALAGLAANAAGRGAGVVLVAGAGLAVLTFVAKQFATLYGFTLRESPQGLRIVSGLLGVRSQTVPFGRVQGLVMVEPLLWRTLGWVRVDVTVAGVAQGGSDNDQLASTLLPVATRAEAEALAQRVLDADHTAVRLQEAPTRASWLAPLTRRRLRVGWDATLVVTTRGLLTTRTDVVPRAKIQSVHLVQGLLQRLLGLATVRLDIPSGPVAALAAHRDQVEAWQLAISVVDGGPEPTMTP